MHLHNRIDDFYKFIQGKNCAQLSSSKAATQSEGGGRSVYIHPASSGFSSSAAESSADGDEVLSGGVGAPNKLDPPTALVVFCKTSCAAWNTAPQHCNAHY